MDHTHRPALGNHPFLSRSVVNNEEGGGSQWTEGYRKGAFTRPHWNRRHYASYNPNFTNYQKFDHAIITMNNRRNHVHRNGKHHVESGHHTFLSHNDNTILSLGATHADRRPSAWQIY